MLVQLLVESAHVSLVCEPLGFDKRRPLEVAVLERVVGQYGAAQERLETPALLDLGRELYRWLDGKDGWLGGLRPRLMPPFEPPFVLEVQSRQPLDAATWLVLQAPWELLADEVGFLAEDAILRFAPARRLGQPRAGHKPDDHRLGIAFMASAPRGASAELDYEAEEAAILTAAPEDVDLFVEDSGDPEELGRRLNAFETVGPVLHLSCHGHNAWRAKAGTTPQPVLMMEDAHGLERPTTPSDLIGAIEPYQPRLLLLSACLSAAAGNGEEPVTDSIASALVRAGVPAVLGWDGSVADVAATAFARKLYDGLSRRQTVIEAAAAARRTLLNSQAASGSTISKDAQGSADLERQLADEQKARRRDWHLARVWLGPKGGGPVVGGGRERSMLPSNYEYEQVLRRKGNDKQLVVAGPAMFVGRRRELQTALRVLDGKKQAGVLLHGMGRLGKTSLAARIASRRRDLTLVVVYENYDALSVLDALREALEDHEPACTLLDERKAAVRADAAALERTLIDLLAGPCKRAADNGRPVLLLIDDLEQILEADGDHYRVRDAERPVLRAVLRAFRPERSDSRLLVTSRYPFSIVDAGEDLAAKLHPLQLPSFQENTRHKLTRRQVEAARTRSGPALDEAALAARLPLLEQAQQVARGNPGLQDLVGGLVLHPAMPQTQVAAVLTETENYLAGGDLPSNEAVREFLQKLKMDELFKQAGSAGQALLQAALLFDIPVPLPALEALAAKVGGVPDHLRALGLLDPFEDLVNHRVTALAVNGLAAGRLKPLTEQDEALLASSCLPALSEAWGGAEGAARRPYAADIELTRLGLLAGNADVVATCAGDAVWFLQHSNLSAKAVMFGQAAIDLLEKAGREPSLRLLADTAYALGTAGEGEAATAVLRKGNIRLDNAAEADLDPSELSWFLFARGARQVTAGELDAAQGTYEQLCALEIAHQNEYQLAVARGRIADILARRGELDEALRIRREDVLPALIRLDDVREIAVARGKIADILAGRGELDEALRIYREEELPVYTRLGDVRAIAVAQGRIADILERRKEL